MGFLFVSVDWLEIKGRRLDMLSVGELKNICANIEREYGSDANVCLQFLDKEDHAKEAGYCLGFFVTPEGNLYLTTK